MSETNEEIKEVEPIVKRPRGRPKKEAIPTDETIIKRPRGRPRKEKPPTEATEKPPRKKQETYKFYGNEKEYFVKYYNEKRRNPCNCPFCDKTFVNDYALNNHVQFNKDCKIKRLEKELEQIKGIVNK